MNAAIAYSHVPAYMLYKYCKEIATLYNSYTMLQIRLPSYKVMSSECPPSLVGIGFLI